MASQGLVLLGGLCALAVACVPPGSDEPVPGSGGASEGTSTSGSGPGSTSLATTSGDDGTTAAATADSDGTTGDAPASVCDPPPESVSAHVWVEFDESLLDTQESVELDLACVVADVATVDDLVSIQLDCDDGPHGLDVSDLGPIDLAVGQEVVLRALLAEPWWPERYVIVLRGGEVIVAGLLGSSVPEGDAGPWSPDGTFFEPLGIEVLPDVCDPEPLEDEGMFLPHIPDCTQDQRQALRFALDGRTTEVYDSGRGSLGSLEIAVVAARAHVTVTCSDVPNNWYSFLAVRTR